MTLQEWANLAQLVIALATSLGVVASLYAATKALREVQADRRHRQMPHLCFERGGYRYSVEFVKCKAAIPGVDPAFAKKMLGDIPTDAESVRIIDRKRPSGGLDPVWVGDLTNYGTGPAFSGRVTWIAEKIFIGDEEFTVDEKKRREPLYNTSLNSMPTVPSHIAPSGHAGLPRLPAFIEKDYDKKLTSVEGRLRITADDVFGLSHVVEQEFYIFTGYKEDPPWVHVTFSELLQNGKE